MSKYPEGFSQRGFVIADDLWKNGQKLAAERGISMSDIIRAAVQSFVDSPGPVPAKKAEPKKAEPKKAPAKKAAAKSAPAKPRGGRKAETGPKTKALAAKVDQAAKKAPAKKAAAKSATPKPEAKPSPVKQDDKPAS